MLAVENFLQTLLTWSARRSRWLLQPQRLNRATVALIAILTLLTAFELHERSHSYQYRKRRPLFKDYKEMDPFGQSFAHWSSSLSDPPFIPEIEEWAITTMANESTCHPKQSLEYDGTLMKTGVENQKFSDEECCEECLTTPNCNVWTWCGSVAGCGKAKFRECWLKEGNLKDVLQMDGFFHFSIGWISGSCFPKEERDRVLNKEKRRLKALKDNPKFPLLYMDMTIKGIFVGRMKFVLFTDIAPLASENFRALCTGEKGIVPAGRVGAGKLYTYRGNGFYNISDRYLLQAGSQTESIYGGYFKDDPEGLNYKHDRKGLLSMVNRGGPDTNAGEFSIVMAPSPQLNGKSVVFGEIVEGMEVAHRINYLATDKPSKMAGIEEEAFILDCGELRWKQ